MILYAGSYTQEVGPGLSGSGEGIYCFDFNDETGALKLIHTVTNRNTSYLSISKNKKVLYSFQEVALEKNPIVLAFSIENDYSLKLLNQQPIEGGLPCHLSLINVEMLGVACYGTGSVHVFPVEENGMLGKCTQNTYHKGKSVNVERQEAAHAHMVSIFNNEIFVPDLGIDSVVIYAIKEEKSLIEKYKVKVPLGEGPRHIVFHPNEVYAFVMNELTGNISILKENEGEFRVIQNINSLPEDYKGTPSAAAIQISSCGKFLYCSNRGSETITIFEFSEEEGSLVVKGFQSVYGITPRDFIISPNGKWLLVANQDSNEVVTFKIHAKTGLLEKLTVNKEAKSVVCLKWL